MDVYFPRVPNNYISYSCVNAYGTITNSDKHNKK